MKPAELKSKRPSRGFSIDSIIGEPTHNTRRNDTPTISDHNTLCPSPPRNSRETGDKRGIAKPTPTHLPAPTSFRESLAAGKEDRVLPLPVSLPPLLHPHPQFRGKIGAGAEGKMPPGPLALRSVWGMTSALERSSLGVSPGVPPAGSRPALLPQHLSQPVGSLPLPLPLPQGLLNGLSARDSLHHSLHPWLLARHAHCLGYPLFGSAEANFLYHWSRKPKRIRTAFSPGQLLRLEQTFDNSHYVVGQERKELADKLSLTETQVKVWFQNRRTKFKRMKAEEGDDTGAPAEQEQEEDEEEANPFPHPRDLDQVSDGDSCSANSQHHDARAVVGQPRGQSVDTQYEPLYTSS